MITPAEHRLPVPASRIAAAVVVVTAHVAALLLFPALQRFVPARGEEHALIVFVVPEKTPGPPVAAEPRERPPRKRQVAVTPQLPSSSAITLRPGSSPPKPQPDWHLESEGAAARYLAQLEEEERRSASMGKSGPSRDPLVPPGTPDFGWSHERTHRVERLEGGGVIIWITERCAIVVILVPIPVCEIGEIKARGDLFEHMNDPPRLGDWKE